MVPVAFAPQLKLLRLARLAIVHGGFNTVKECVYFGVPMVVVPWTNDQPGNAARVVFHGLGVQLDKDRVTVEALLKAFDRVLLQPLVSRKALR